MVFTCSICGREHQAVTPAPAEFSDEEITIRRAKWVAADEKLSKNPKNPHLEQDYMKAWFSYGETLPWQSRNAPSQHKLPPTITTRLGSGGHGYCFVCTSHVEP